MNDEPMMIDETEEFDKPRRSTQRSWKMFQFVVAGLLTVFVVAMMLADHGGETFGGATEASIAKFEQAMNDYFDAAQRRGLARVSMRSYDPLVPDAQGVADERLAGTDKERRRVQEAVGEMNYSNKRKAEDMFTVLAALHNSSLVSDTANTEFDWTTARPLENESPWVMRNIPAGIWLAFKTAVIAFVAAWLLLKLCELLWWFLMDRLHDVANAVRKH